jgi:integrase
MDAKSFSHLENRPEEVVAHFTARYPNPRTRSSSLSLFKRLLRDSPNPPPNSYLDKLLLPPEVYEKINHDYAKLKNMEGHHVPVVRGVNDAVEWAINNIDSNKPHELWPAVIITSGFRPSEILTSSFIPYDGPRIIHDKFYISTYDLAKKRGASRTVIRAHPLLVRASKWLTAVDKLRSTLGTGDSRHTISNRYGSTWLRWIRKAFPQIRNVTHTLLRRIFATYAFYCYRDDYMGEVGRIAFIQDVLGHEGLGTSAIYSQIKLDQDHVIDIFNES